MNNNIEYGLFQDVISSYYLDSQIKDDFNCDKECYANTLHALPNQQFTSCTQAYDHITQHINNLANTTQQIHYIQLKRTHHYLPPHHENTTLQNPFLLHNLFLKVDQN